MAPLTGAVASAPSEQSPRQLQHAVRRRASTASRLSKLLACTIAASSLRGTIAQPSLPTTRQCRSSMITMLDDENWQFMNDTATRWCRVILENKMSSCCSNAEFAKGKADDCPDCVAKCMHEQYITFCNKYFGKACLVKRKPFHANGVQLQVEESFCIPEDCDNTEDLTRSAIIKWFAWHYRSRRLHWHYDYDEAEIICPNNVAVILVSVVGGFIAVLALIPIALFLFKAPKEKGRVRVSQEDMQGPEEVEPIGADETLRSAAFGGDTLGSGTGMGALTSGTG